jgi:hypothetical protein
METNTHLTFSKRKAKENTKSLFAYEWSTEQTHYVIIRSSDNVLHVRVGIMHVSLCLGVGCYELNYNPENCRTMHHL